MSEIKKITVDGQEFTFVNSFRSNRSGFVHETDLFMGERHIAHNKSQYYNRTWESYTYQSSMRQCVYVGAGEHKQFLIEEYKRKTGVKKMNEQQKAAVSDPDLEMKLYAELLQVI